MVPKDHSVEDCVDLVETNCGFLRESYKIIWAENGVAVFNDFKKPAFSYHLESSLMKFGDGFGDPPFPLGGIGFDSGEAKTS